MINQEDIYNLLKERGYKKLLNSLYNHREQIKSEVILLEAAQVVEKELLRVAENEKSNEDFWVLVETLHAFHPKLYQIQPDNFKKLTLLLADKHQSNVKKSIKYANLFPEEKICQVIIQEHSQTEPQILEHNREEEIKLSHNPIPTNQVAKKSLFQSQEETKLFLALKRIFSTYQIYPNVPTNCLIDLKQIEPQLTKKEISFFHTSVIDFVVFEPFDNYRPIYFIELDSVWHNIHKNKENDQTKDKIFSLAGLRLIRIRHLRDELISQDTFLELVREIRIQVQEAD